MEKKIVSPFEKLVVEAISDLEREIMGMEWTGEVDRLDQDDLMI